MGVMGADAPRVEVSQPQALHLTTVIHKKNKTF